ncbi:MAG: response regulator [Betaproteobacteria bacterium]
MMIDGTKKSFPHKRDQQQRAILLVDDDADNLVRLEKVLQDWGYGVITATDARAALSKIQAGIDLIITDYRMPGMDGLEFMDVLRRERSAPPVIMLTAYAGVDSYLEATSLGVYEYVNKPVRNAELKRIISAALHSAGS